MRSLNIGFDFDGVITNPVKVKTKWAREKFGISLRPEQTDKQSMIHLFGEKNYNEFKSLYYSGSLALEVDIRPKAIKAISLFNSFGHNVFIVTSRLDDEYEKAKELLNFHQIKHKQAVNTSGESKEKYCQDLELDFLLDYTLEKLEKISKEVKTEKIWFNPYFKKNPSKIKDVKSWSEFGEIIARKEEMMICNFLNNKKM